MRAAWPLLAFGALAAGLLLAVASGTLEARAVPWMAVALLAAGAVLGRRAAQQPAGPAPSAQVSAAEYAPPFAGIIDALPDPVLVIAALEPDDLADRRIVLLNAAARETLRLAGERAMLVTAIRAPHVLEAVDEALFGKIAAQVPYEIGGAQGRMLMAFAKPLGIAPDGAHLALLVLRDETDLRQAERMRADFLANASHELRTPLASLSGFIETLQGPARDDEKARDRFLAIMQVQAERMARLIDDLMSLSRIEANEHVAPQDEVDLTMTVMDVIDALGPLARDKGVEMEVRLPGRGEAVVIGDRDQIVQVVQNLVFNGLKFSPKGASLGVELDVGVTADAAAALRNPRAARMTLLAPDVGRELYAALRVSDGGCGLAREHLPRLTERFYRVEGQKSGHGSGTGLGLAIVKHVMNRHRGGLAVESAQGEGAMFTAYFPLAQNTK